MSDDNLYICSHCGSSNNNEWCSCRSQIKWGGRYVSNKQTISRNDNYYYNDDPSNYSNDELDKYDEK